MGRLSALHRLWRPSLMRRVLLALLLAFGLVAIALIGLNYLEFQRQVTEHAGVEQLNQALLATMAKTADTRDAELIARQTVAVVNRIRLLNGQLPGDLLLRLRGSDGRIAWESPELAGAALPLSPGKVEVLRIAGRPYWTVELAQGPWQLLLAEPALGDATLLEFLWRDLARSMLVAFPLVLLPLWLAVWGGCGPCGA